MTMEVDTKEKEVLQEHKLTTKSIATRQWKRNRKSTSYQVGLPRKIPCTRTDSYYNVVN